MDAQIEKIRRKGVEAASKCLATAPRRAVATQVGLLDPVEEGEKVGKRMQSSVYLKT